MRSWREVVKEDCQALKLNTEDAMDRSKWRKLTDNHASTSPLSFLLAGCPYCRPTNIIKALKAKF